MTVYSASVNMDTGEPSEDYYARQEEEGGSSRISSRLGETEASSDPNAVLSGSGSVSSSPSGNQQESIIGSARSSTGGNPTGSDNDMCFIPGEGWTSVGAAKVRGFLQPDGKGGLEDAQGAKEQAQEVQQQQQAQAEQEAQSEAQELEQMRQDYDVGGEAKEVVGTLQEKLGHQGADAVIGTVVGCITSGKPAEDFLAQYSGRTGMEPSELVDLAQKGISGLTGAGGDYMADQHGVDAEEVFQAIQDRKIHRDTLTDAMFSHIYQDDVRVWDKVAKEFIKKKGRGEL